MFSINLQNRHKSLISILLLGSSLLVLFLLSRMHFLLFHSIVELFSVLVGWGIFMIAWNTRRFRTNDFYLFLGISFLIISSFDLFHSLCYYGMGLFQERSPNLPTQLWVISRFLQALMLLIAPSFLKRKKRRPLFHYLIPLLTILLVTSLYFQWFPNCYISGQGLTSFKKIAEYLIIITLVISGIFFFQVKEKMDEKSYKWILYFIVLTILAEFCFTLYQDVYGLFNFTGHNLKWLSFYFIYKAVLQNGLIFPHQILEDRNKELAEALTIIDSIKGSISICMFCKKIKVGHEQDHQWESFEAYVTRRSSAIFTHSLCHDCLKDQYPEHWEEVLNK